MANITSTDLIALAKYLSDLEHYTQEYNELSEKLAVLNVKRELRVEYIKSIISKYATDKLSDGEFSFGTPRDKVPGIR